jgi:hypothetical protein
MRVIPPITITDAILTSTNVPEADYASWSAATTYALGDKVIVVDTDYHHIFESLQGSNLNHDPQDEDQDAPEWWLDLGPTNRWKMFDLLRNTQTTVASPITVELTPGERIDSIAFVGLDADSVTVTVVNDAVEVYSSTTDLIDRTTLTWSGYFFGEFDITSGFLLTDIPRFSGNVVTINIVRDGGNVSCGGVVIGTNVYLGEVQYEAESDALNFSRIERDEFGNSQLLPRRSIPKSNQTLFTDKVLVDKIMKTRTTLNAVPAIWSGLDDETDGYFAALFILGIYKQFLISLRHPEHAIISLELEEV